jgi:hypothetical protein
LSLVVGYTVANASEWRPVAECVATDVIDENAFSGALRGVPSPKFKAWRGKAGEMKIEIGEKAAFDSTKGAHISLSSGRSFAAFRVDIRFSDKAAFPFYVFDMAMDDNGKYKARLGLQSKTAWRPNLIAILDCK